MKYLETHYLDDEESGDKAGVIAGYFGNMTAVDSMLENCSATNATVNAARDAGQLIGCLAMDITSPQTTSSQRNNTATSVVVTDNNLIQDVSINDNVKNNVVGRIHNARLDYWEGTVTTIPAEDAYGVIKITNGRQLAAIAQAVNAGNTFAGKTIKLEKDIDLQNHEWTPIGYGYKKDDVVTGACFKGTFDGQNHTIYNLKITGSIGGKDGIGAAGVGLFGYAHNAHISNIRIDGAAVSGNHYVAAVVGFTYFSTIDDCDVVNASITCSLLNEEENGDKAGVITGYVDESNLTNCNVSYCTVSASRDAGQLIGCESNGMASNGEEDITTGNSANDVVVLWNNTGTGKNIRDEFVGRDS